MGIGADIDVLPELRLVANLNKLEFDNTNVLGTLRQQRPPSTDLGIDASVGFQYRPFFSQNIVVNGSFAKLLPGKGYKELFPEDKDPYSFLFNVILSF